VPTRLGLTTDRNVTVIDSSTAPTGPRSRRWRDSFDAAIRDGRSVGQSAGDSPLTTRSADNPTVCGGMNVVAL
jgi:hypothetical protein